VKAVPRSRQVSYHQSFGGRPIDLPDVSQHSTIETNTDKVSLINFIVTGNKLQPSYVVNSFVKIVRNVKLTAIVRAQTTNEVHV
jgi:hypothetical protein